MICEPAVITSDQISKISRPNFENITAKKTVNLHYLIYIIYVGTNNNRIDHCIT